MNQSVSGGDDRALPSGEHSRPHRNLKRQTPGLPPPPAPPGPFLTEAPRRLLRTPLACPQPLSPPARSPNSDAGTGDSMCVCGERALSPPLRPSPQPPPQPPNGRASRPAPAPNGRTSRPGPAPNCRASRPAPRVAAEGG